MSKAKALQPKDAVLCGLFTALISIGAFINVPLFGVPFSLQLFFVTLSALILGKKSMYSALIYMILGLIGLPIFTKGGGFWYVFQPSFGYILGFIFTSFFCGKIIDTYPKPSFKKYLLAGFLCVSVTYAIGMFYFWLINTLYLGNPVTSKILFTYLFLPLIPGDIVLTVF